jgi:Fe-coproporphyrin III synthase
LFLIDISYLFANRESQSVAHRYGVRVHGGAKNQGGSFALPASASERKPVVVWNITRTCNLKCIHCYSNSEHKRYAGELTNEEARKVIDDLAGFQIPVLLFSGGEPLLRRDLFELASYANTKGIRMTLSTNGTVIDRETAAKIKGVGFSYVGVSLDGMEEVHDFFRGTSGAFRKTISGIRNLIAMGQKTGLRLTLTEYTIDQIDSLFDLIVAEGIRRVCFYHLVPSGRGEGLFKIDSQKVRHGMDRILKRTKEIANQGYPLEVLTVDNHADGPYLYLKLLEQGNPRAGAVYKRLLWNGGGLYSSGVGIACIDPQGNVHPDQFWSHYSLGNVREHPFSAIWTDPAEPLLRGLRNRKEYVYGRCRQCRFFELCGGALRVRADLSTGDPWGPDPGCYLTDEEISVDRFLPAGKV